MLQVFLTFSTALQKHYQTDFRQSSGYDAFINYLALSLKLNTGCQIFTV